MDYQNIHDSIIERAKLRTEKLDQSNCHTVFLNDTEFVLLTTKENLVINNLRNILNKKSHVLTYSEAGKLGGDFTKNNKVGIFREDLQHLRTEWATIGANALQEAGTRSGFCGKEWRERNKDKVLENASNAGKIGGKAVGSMLWWNNGVINKKSNECPSDGWVRGKLLSEKQKLRYGIS